MARSSLTRRIQRANVHLIEGGQRDLGNRGWLRTSLCSSLTTAMFYGAEHVSARD